MTMLPLGVFDASGPGGAFNLAGFTKQLGREPDEVRGYTTYNGSWAHMVECLNVAFDVYKDVKQPIVWSLGLCDTVENVAAGVGRAQIAQVFKTILARSRPDGVLWVRVAWEQTLDDYKWSSNGREASWIKMFRTVVGIGRSVSPRFKFEWCPAINPYHKDADGMYHPVDPTKSWPGPFYVDRIAFDMYLSGNPKVDFADDLRAWSWKLYGAGWGLYWLVKFGQQNGRPIGLGEFGFGRECPVFAQRQFAWMAANKVYGNYFNAVDAKGDWRIFQYPQTAKLFVETFGAAPTALTAT